MAAVWSEPGVVLPPGRDQVAQERHPVPVVVIQPIPQGPDASPPREVRQQGRLAVAGVGQDQDDAVMDLRGDPIQQPVPGQRLVTKRRPLDLRGLDRIPGHAVKGSEMGGPSAERPGPLAGCRGSVWVASGGWGGANDMDGSRWVSTELSGPDMAAIMAGFAHPSISCDPGRRRCPPTRLAVVFEADLDLDPYSTISPSSTIAHDLTTSTVWMLRTVFDAVATAWRAASLHERGLVPTMSRMMMTPTAASPAADERPS